MCCCYSLLNIKFYFYSIICKQLNKHIKTESMYKLSLIVLLICLSINIKAQNNTFPTPSGNVGIGTTTPSQKLDVVGNVYLRNMTNAVGGGTSISFSSYDLTHLGPKIYSYLDFASGTASQSRLVLSSYSNGYQNEITLNGGNVGIGTMTPSDKLSVNGNIRAKQVKVETANWPDYVFTKKYILPEIGEVKSFIDQNGHLPGIPSAKETTENGVNVGEMSGLLLKKIEELTLYVIDLQGQIDQLKNKNLGNQSGTVMMKQ